MIYWHRPHNKLIRKQNFNIPERIIVSNNATGLCPELVDLDRLVRKMGQLHPLLLDVQQVGISVEVVQSKKTQLNRNIKQSSEKSNYFSLLFQTHLLNWIFTIINP